VFVNEPPPQDGVLPNGEPKRFSPQASTLIYGSSDAVLTDPGLTTDQARAVGDWVAGKGRKVTDIFITHGHGDHWFAAGPLAERLGARVVASAGTIAQMHAGVVTRPLLWDKLYSGIPPSPVTAVTVPDNRFTLEGHELAIVEVGPLRQRRYERSARSGSRAGRRRGRDLQRRPHVPCARDRRLRALAGGDP
jgi:glyoxylase-like metal-dependent hydrolase (beta-lactamase superfamily II)